MLAKNNQGWDSDSIKKAANEFNVDEYMKVFYFFL